MPRKSIFKHILKSSLTYIISPISILKMAVGASGRVRLTSFKEVTRLDFGLLPWAAAGTVHAGRFLVWCVGGRNRI